MPNNFLSNRIFRLAIQRQQLHSHREKYTRAKGLRMNLAIPCHLVPDFLVIKDIMVSLFGFKARKCSTKLKFIQISWVALFMFCSKLQFSNGAFCNLYKRLKQLHSFIQIFQFWILRRMRLKKNHFKTLVNKSIYYYQTDWNLIGLRFQDLNNEITEYQPFLNNQGKVFNLVSNNKSLTEGIAIVVKLWRILVL
jgi:hypothetical protein